MKILVHPLTGKQYRLGRNHPKHPHGRSSFRDMLNARVLPQVTVPDSTNYAAAAQPALADIYGNDSLGDCTIAAGFHIRGVTSFNGGQGIVFTEDQVVQDYSAITGYDPNAVLVDGQNPTDQGADENTVLAYWAQTGFPDGVLLDEYVSVNAADDAEVRLACYLFENLYFAVDLPDEFVSPMPSGSGFAWNLAGDPEPENGHAFSGVDLVPGGIVIDSWGMTGTFSQAAIEYYASPAQGGALFTLLSPDVISRLTQKSPAGYDIGALTEYLGQL